MPLPSTMTPIATQTLSATAASMTFSSIPQGYTDLKVIIVGYAYTSDSYGGLQIRFNGDSGANYSHRGMFAITSVVAYSNNNMTHWAAGVIQDFTTGSNTFVSSAELNIMNYSNTTTYKTGLARTSVPKYRVDGVVGVWRNTAAITSLTVTPTDTPLNVGTIVTIYGIKAA